MTTWYSFNGHFKWHPGYACTKRLYSEFRRS